MIRDATNADVPVMVQVHLSSFPSFFLTELGARFLRTMYSRMLLLPETIAVIAEGQDGEVVGFVVGATSQADFWRRLLVEHWLAFALAAVGPVLRRPRIALRVLRAVRRPAEAAEMGSCGLIASIAVLQSMQGMHVGATLVSAFLCAARRFGTSAVSLTTDADNNAYANAFFRKQAFTLRRQFRTPEGRCMNEYVIELDKPIPYEANTA